MPQLFFLTLAMATALSNTDFVGRWQVRTTDFDRHPVRMMIYLHADGSGEEHTAQNDADGFYFGLRWQFDAASGVLRTESCYLPRAAKKGPVTITTWCPESAKWPGVLTFTSSPIVDSSRFEGRYVNTNVQPPYVRKWIFKRP